MKTRLDIYLVTHNYAQSRNQANEMIKKGLILINDVVVTKKNTMVDETNKIMILDKWKFVSRAGYKLEQAILAFKIDFYNKIVLDIGSSTGGFVDCSLQYGAKKVYALDVGTNQLDNKLVNNSKVINWEKTNLKTIPDINFNDTIDIITSDVSFISLTYVIDAVKNILHDNITLILLIKPQFELNHAILIKNKYCIVDKKLQQNAIDKIVNYANKNGLKLVNLIPSNLPGAKNNNIEFLAYFKFNSFK